MVQLVCGKCAFVSTPAKLVSKSEPNGSGNNVFMHADNGKWFDMDGEGWTGPYVCVRDIEWIEEDIHMEEHHSGARETLTAAAAMAMLLL